MSHTCHAEGCAKPVPPRMFSCARHWRMVPVKLQRALWREYRDGQEDRKDPSRRYLVVQALCRAAIARREGRDHTAPLESLRRMLTMARKARPGLVDPATLTDAQVVGLWMRAVVDSPAAPLRRT